MDLFGSIGNTIGGVMSANSQKSAASRMRKLLVGLYQDTSKKMDAAQTNQMETLMRGLQQATTAGNQTYAASQNAGNASLLSVLANPAYKAQAAYLMEAFDQGIPESQANAMSSRLRTAQAAQGIEGGAAAYDEAKYLTQAADERRQELLPQLRQLAMDPFQIKQAAVTSDLQNRGAAQGIGFQNLQQLMGVQSAAINNANQEVLPLAQLGASLYGQVPYSAANPWANLSAGIGQTMDSASEMIMSLFGGAGGAAAGLGGQIAKTPTSFFSGLMG
ncbi:MAG: hypothetical protein WC683_07165 [bacterium]